MELAAAKPERKTIFGSMAFGTGWAVAGTCPGPALAMAAGGTFLGIFVIAGLATGVWLRNEVAEGRLRGLTGTIKRRAGLAR